MDYADDGYSLRSMAQQEQMHATEGEVDQSAEGEDRTTEESIQDTKGKDERRS